MQNVTGPAGASTAASPHQTVAQGRPSLKARAVSEMKKVIIVVMYLWVLFALFSFYRRLVLQQNGISVWEQSFAIVNALIFGKVILIAQALKLDAGLRKYPLLYTVLGNAFLFAVVLFAFHVFEEGVRALVSGRQVATAISAFGGGTLWGFLTVGAIMFICLIPFFAIDEVARVIGGQALWDLFFSSRKRRFRLVEE